MAQYRADKSGINAEVQKKLEDAYDEDLEHECREWMEHVTGEPFPEADEADVEALAKAKGKMFKGIHFHVSLKDGTYLLRVIKALDPDNNARLRIPSKMPTQPFKQRDLIQHFITSCVAYGVPKESMFETEDLHSAINMNMVLCSLVALGSTARKNGFEGPEFGPKLADKNVREFDEETLQEGKLVIGLQMGSNMGASQSGMTPYGQGRQIHDPKIPTSPTLFNNGMESQFDFDMEPQFENGGELYPGDNHPGDDGYHLGDNHPGDDHLGDSALNGGMPTYEADTMQFQDENNDNDIQYNEDEVTVA